MVYTSFCRVDNNLILLLTLDIFEDEDERFMKVTGDLGWAQDAGSVEHRVLHCSLSDLISQT